MDLIGPGQEPYAPYGPGPEPLWALSGPNEWGQMGAGPHALAQQGPNESPSREFLPAAFQKGIVPSLVLMKL